ncbi:MAG: PilZ domain-containing protein [Bryobacteraceae bacterium]
MHLQTEHLELYALGELSENLSGMVETHLKDCVVCGILFEESRATIGQWVSREDEYCGREKRRGPRVATDDPAVLTVLEPPQPGRVKIRIVDASKEGLKLLTPDALIRGTVVQIRVRDLFVMAEVRYCRPAGIKFHAGVHIQDVFPACG